MSCSKQILSENMEQDHQVDQVKVIPLASLRHCETWIAPSCGHIWTARGGQEQHKWMWSFCPLIFSPPWRLLEPGALCHLVTKLCLLQALFHLPFELIKIPNIQRPPFRKEFLRSVASFMELHLVLLVYLCIIWKHLSKGHLVYCTTFQIFLHKNHIFMTNASQLYILKITYSEWSKPNFCFLTKGS